jgi:ubiquinone/menaquinone biosynthesis C-methylase UbiE
MFLARQRWRQADRLIPHGYRGGCILDIGCGANPLLLSKVVFADKYGLDKVIDDGGAERGRDLGFTLIRHDVETDGRLPCGNDYFDVVTMLAVYEHLERGNLAVLLKEIYRVLKPGGIHVATTPRAGTAGLLGFMAKMRLVSATEIHEHKEAYTRPDITSMLVHAGFPEGNVASGYFEGFMNLWVRARK